MDMRLAHSYMTLRLASSRDKGEQGMPWNKDGGNGGGRNPWGQGPWGQGPSGPSGGGGRGPTPPDLDDLIKRGQDSLKNLIPLGGGRMTWIVPLLLVLIFVIFRSVYQVQADERGVVLRLGAYARTAEPGLHFAIWPVETLEKVRFAAQRQSEIGGGSDGLMLAGDQNIVSVKFTVFWRVKDAEAYLFNVSNQETVIRAVAESAMREIIGRTPAEEFRTTGRKAAEDQVFDITQATLDSYQSGVILTGIRLNEADPPPEVRDAFAEVQRAEQDQAKLINEADQYSNQKLRRAEGEAAKVIEEGKSYKAQVTFDAQGDSQRFLKVLEQYAKAKDVTRERLFIETMEGILSQTNKVILGGEGGQNILPYLPLPAIENRKDVPPPPDPNAANIQQGAGTQ
ncbi:FtsH protease activity modulator HflK [soil metagenome]